MKDLILYLTSNLRKHKVKTSKMDKDFKRLAEKYDLGYKQAIKDIKFYIKLNNLDNIIKDFKKDVEEINNNLNKLN